MTAAVEDVATALLRRIGLPGGMVSTLVQSDVAGSYIRLMLVPELIGRLAWLPPQFMGYRVLVGGILPPPRPVKPPALRRTPLRTLWRRFLA